MERAESSQSALSRTRRFAQASSRGRNRNMRLSETELKEVYQKSTARSSRTECLTADEIARISTAEVDEEERQQMSRHLMTCSDCAEEYRLINPLKSLAASAEAGTVAG